MNEPRSRWSSAELYELAKRRGELFPHQFEFHGGDWWATRGPKHDFAIGAGHVEAVMLEKAKELLGPGGSACNDLSAAVAELDRRSSHMRSPSKNS